MNLKSLCLALIYVPLLAVCATSQTDRNKPVQAGVPGTLLANCRRVVFLGDSITYSGQFVDDVEMVLRRLAPDSDFEFLNLGLPSETVSGLSEPGHAGGTFPRPNLHDRLERLLELTHPDLVIACYGMNDGIYYPFDQAKFEAYQRGIELLRRRVIGSGAKIIHVTPPVFDSFPIRAHTLPAGLAEYRQPFEGYDTVLERYSEWLLGERKNGWSVIDTHSPMKHFLQQERLKNPAFLLASDGVHLNNQGHWLVAQAILKGLKAPIVSERVVLDLSAGKAKGFGVSHVQKQDGGLSFVWRMRPSLPLPGGNSETGPSNRMENPAPHGEELCLVGRRPKAATYEVFANDELVGTISQEALSAGLDTRSFAKLPTTVRSREILALIHTRNHTLSDSWLTTVGHKRPGMEKGLPLQEATAQAESLNRKIKELSQPVEVRLRVTPVR